VARETQSPSGSDRLGISRRSGERFGPFVTRVANAFGLVLLLVVATFVLGSLTPPHGWAAVLTTAVAVTAAVVALASADVRLPVVRASALFAVGAVICAALAELLDERALLGASGLVTAALLLLAAGAVLRSVVGESEVGFRTILGAISVYIILGLLFSYLYAAIDRIGTDPFFAGGASTGDGNTLLFSFYTLTTTGYGNLVPAAQPGKLFAGLEMLVGNIFLVTLVAGLVSLWRPGAFVKGRRRGKDQAAQS
jgi:hypothetical protein